MIGIHSLRKTFKTGTDLVQAVDGVDLQVNEREFFVLLGLSGSGKTTLLRCVAGLERPDAGEIFLGEQIVSSAEESIFITPEDRAIGMVFQSYAVWPHMTVFENVAFPLTDGKRRLPRAKVRDRVMGALEMVQLISPRRSTGSLSQRRPTAESGAGAGAGCRAQGAFDGRAAEQLGRAAKRGSSRRDPEPGKKTRYHGSLCDSRSGGSDGIGRRIAVMSGGRILQIGAPKDLYHFPLNQKVGEFLGSMNEFEGTLQSDGCVNTDLGVIHCTIPNGTSKEVIVAIRPEDVLFYTTLVV